MPKKSRSGGKKTALQQKVVVVNYGDYLRYLAVWKLYRAEGEALCQKYGIEQGACECCQQPIPVGFIPKQ